MENKSKIENKLQLRNLNGFEITFIFGVLFLHLALLYNVISNYAIWSDFPFIFSFVTVVLTFLQFFIRYIGITVLYNTEASLSSWSVSLIILAISASTVYYLKDLDKWLISYGILLLFAGIKNFQTRRKMVSMKIFTADREARLREFSTVEVSFGILILVCAIALNIQSFKFFNLDYNTSLFMITFFTFYFSIISVVISITRIITHKSLIDIFFREKY